MLPLTRILKNSVVDQSIYGSDDFSTPPARQCLKRLGHHCTWSTAQYNRELHGKIGESDGPWSASDSCARLSAATTQEAIERSERFPEHTKGKASSSRPLERCQCETSGHASCGKQADRWWPIDANEGHVDNDSICNKRAGRTAARSMQITPGETSIEALSHHCSRPSMTHESPQKRQTSKGAPYQRVTR